MIKITQKDLVNLHSFAVKNCVDLSIHSEYHKDNSKLQAYCYILAVIGLLNSKGEVHLDIEVDNGVKDDG